MFVEVSLFSHWMILLRFFAGRHVKVDLRSMKATRCSYKFGLCAYCIYNIRWSNDKFLKLQKERSKMNYDRMYDN